MKYAWIADHRDSFPVAVMCRVLDVSKSGFYESCKRQPSERSMRAKRIREAVHQVHAESHGIYGSEKIAAELERRDDMERACVNTVKRAMREMGLKSRVSKKFRPTTTTADPSKKPAPNVLDREFEAVAPNTKWVTDITYLPTNSGWVYLAVVIDLFSRKVVGWSVADSLATDLVAAALRQAVESRRPVGSQLLHHSDRGCQYTSDAYQQVLNAMGITCSMSRTGCCYDNAVAERFFWSLKHEWTEHVVLEDLEHARRCVFEYIAAFYNSQRIHKTLNYMSPDQFEAEHTPVVAL